MRCLIIDDDDSPRLLMERLITGAGHRVHAVSTGAAALRALETQGYDVAIVDLELPGLSGADTILRMRRVAPELRVLVVSGYDDRRHVLAALAAGADGYLLKDELHESLGRSVAEVRAGHSPLSPRVAAVIVRQARRAPSEPPLARPSAVARVRYNPRLGKGTGSNPALDDETDDDR
jgi:DNA-binding NarL/FixJ family response regulator